MPFISSGTKLSISASKPTTIDNSGFSVLPFTQIKGVRSAGDISVQYQTVSREVIGETPSNMKVGLATSSLQLELIRIIDDGQTILINSVASVYSYAFKVERPDSSIVYFSASATSRLHGVGDTTSIADLRINLELDSVIVEV